MTRGQGQREQPTGDAPVSNQIGAAHVVSGSSKRVAAQRSADDIDAADLVVRAQARPRADLGGGAEGVKDTAVKAGLFEALNQQKGGALPSTAKYAAAVERITAKSWRNMESASS